MQVNHRDGLLDVTCSTIIKVADYILPAILMVVAVVVVMVMMAVELVTIVLMLALIHGRYIHDEPGNVCSCYVLECHLLLCAMTGYKNHNGREVSSV